MKICPKCNAQLADDSVFCTGCGQKIEEETTAQTANICKNCGSPLSSDTQFCTKCGTPVSGVSKPSTQAAALTRPTTTEVSVEPGGSPKSSGKNPALLIGGALIFVLVIGCLLYFNSSSSSGIPKTAEDFVSNYNKVIEAIAEAHGADGKKLVIEKTRHGELGTFADFAGNKIMFHGGKNDNGFFSFSFVINDKLGADETFAAMEGLIKASGGDAKQVMTGLGILSGAKYNLPANYAKEYMYDGKLNFSVDRTGLAPVTGFSVEIRNDNPSKPATSTASNTQQTTPQQNRQSSSPPVAQSPSQNESSNSQSPRRDVVSELMLADVALGDSYSTVRQILGTPYKEERKEHGKIYYYFPSVEVHCKDGIVTTLVSNSPEAKTPRGIHEGSTYRAMLKAYGGNWTRSTYGDLDLYEYSFTAQDGRQAILRFAINNTMDTKVRERVDYISIRY